MPDDATVEILLKWKQENEAVLDLVQAKLAALRVTQDQTNNSVAGSIWGLLTAATGWAQVAVWVGVAAVAFAPLSALILSAAAALISFGVAGAGTLALMGGVAFGVVGLAAGMLLLANHFQWVNNAMTQFTQAWQRVGLDLAQAASKPADQILQFLASFAGYAEVFGKAVITWFGDRTPGILTTVGSVFRSLAPDLQAFGSFLGGVADKIGPQMAGTFEVAVRQVLIPATQGAITNLLALSNWFQKEAPTLGPIVQQIFGGMGSIIQFVASTWAKFNDWIVANWKPTIDQATKDWNTIKDGWKGVDWSAITTGLQGVGTAIKGMGDASSGAIGAVGNFIGMLQKWADNNAFWSGLQGKIIDLGRTIGGFLDQFSALTGIDVTLSGASGNWRPEGQGKGGNTSFTGGSTTKTVNFHQTFNLQNSTDPNQTAQQLIRLMRHTLTT